LAFIGALLQKEGHQASIFDRHVQLVRIGSDRVQINEAMLKHIRRFNPDLIGLNTISPLIYDAVECVELIRQSYSGLVLAGGHHATAMPRLTLEKIPGLNGVVCGEGEFPLTAFANGQDPRFIPGLWWRDEQGAITSTPAEQISELDQLPFPAYELLDMNYYIQPNFNAFHERFISSLSVLSSRGCPQRCEFCTESLTYGKGARFHSVDYVIEWIKKLTTDYPIKGIYFLDNHFLVNENRARSFCEAILSKGLHKKITWVVQARADSIHPSIVRLLKRAGCVSIEIGVESNLQNQLDAANKSATVETNEKALAICRKEGMSSYSFMIMGFPDETVDDLETKLAWVKRNKPTCFGWSHLKIYPGTRLYQKMGARFFEANDWNRQTVQAYYESQLLCSISKKELSQWMGKRFTPYHTWRRCLAALQQNSPFTLASYALKERDVVLELLRWMSPFKTRQ
jgi:radical SAM superfamily enzyme YgiQ (UPF0313 family)